MLNKALVGLRAMCVLLTISSAAAAAPADTVLYATDAVNLHGNWSRVPDATAAGGQLLASSDLGWASTSAPLAAPADYFEFALAVTPNVPYHVWVRLRAAGNSKYNDSAYAQFSDASNGSGAALYPIGTTNGLTLNLATDTTGVSLNGWGWQDGAYWLTQAATLTFSSAGTHTMRIQTREDGLQVDQVVLSPVKYLTKAPGPVTSDATIVAKPVPPSTPYTGTAAALPGTIQAEDFDNGGQGVAYNDTTPGNAGGAYRQTDVDLESSSEGNVDIGWVSAGEWLQYSVNVAAAGPYLLEARVASSGQGGTFHVEFAGQNVTGALTVPNTDGWQNWTTISKAVALGAGAQTMRIVFDTASASSAVGNVNWVRLTSQTSTPYLGTAVSLPGKIQAANFDNGQEGVAYHDTTAGNSGGQYRTTSDVDIEASSLGGYDIGWIGDGEWLTYSVNVVTAGSYALQFQVASTSAAGQMHVVAGGAASAVVAIPNTGSWQTWTTANLVVSLPSGPQVIKVVFDVGGFNLAGITAALQIAPPPPPPPTPPVAPPAPPSQTAAPTTYSAITDRVARAKPALPSLGPAGFTFNDPAFGSTLLRVTDRNTRPDAVSASYRTPSASHQNAWNTTSTLFYLVSTDGTVVPFALDAATGSAARIPSTGGDGGLELNFNIEPQFSVSNANLIYGVSNTGSSRIISQYDFSTGAYSPLVDLDTIVSGLAGTYVGGVATGATTVEDMLVFFGGTSQDQHFYAMWFPTNNLGARKLLDTVGSTINGAPTNVTLNFHLHSASVDKSGRYVFLYPTGVDLGAPRYASQVYIWDTTTNSIVALTSGTHDGGTDVHPGGHDAQGYGYNVNHDCCASSPWDAGQWQFRSLSAPLVTADLINPVLTPQEVYLSDHPSWNNAQPGALVPIISGTFRYGTNPAAWRAWDDEIIAIETDAPGSGAVWRFAHHRSNVGSDSDPTTPYFWYEPRPNVAPNGRWVIFTSNWEKTLGADPGTGTSRQDVFLLQLQ